MGVFKCCTRKWLFVTIIMLAANILFNSWIQAQNLRVLIVTGGHDFEREAFFDMFEDMPDVEYLELIHSQARQIFESDLINRFDILLFYDMVQEIEEEEKVALINVLRKGKGAVFLHHSLVSYQQWDEFENIIGGRYVLSNENQDSSTYRHDVEVPVRIVDEHHPVTLGLDDFIIRDEVYGNFRVLPSVHTLLRTTHPESGNIIAWTNNYGQSRIVYIQLGHDHYAYENPNYRLLLKQAIYWVQ